MFRSYLSLFLAGALFLLVGCGENGDAKNVPTERPAKTAKVELAEIIATDLSETFTLPGSLEAWENLTLAAEYGGPVRWIGPTEGDRLKVGEAILRIDTDTVKANLKRDQAAFEVQQKEIKRYQELLAEQLVSQQQFGNVRSAFEAARANLRQSELALAKSTLKSPISGILDRLYIDRGEYVSPGDPMAQVVQVERMKIIIDVPEKDVGFLTPGQTVEVLPAHLGDFKTATALKGEILHVGFQADPASRTFRVKVAVDNPGQKLRPGMILRVKFLRRDHQGVLAIPLYCVLDRDGKKYVFTTEEHQAVQKPVQLGPVVGGQVIIRAGLEAGDQLIVKGQQLLTDGARVEAQTSKTNQEPVRK